jgi:hypothetical protein
MAEKKKVTEKVKTSKESTSKENYLVSQVVSR